MDCPASVSPVIEGLLRDEQAGDGLRSVLDWLTLPASCNLIEETAALSRRLDLLDRAPLAHAARVRILDIFHDRALYCARELKPSLALSALPVEPTLRGAAEILCALHMRLAKGYLDALKAEGAHRPARAAGHAMVCVLDAYALSVLIGTPDPSGTWGVANVLLIHARAAPTARSSASGSNDAEQLYRQLVALALAQPPHLAPPDFFSVAEYVRSYSGAVQIQGLTPHRDLDSWFWLDDELDRGPIPVLRTPAPEGRAGHIVYCSCQRLGQVLGQHLDLIDEGGSPNELHLPACLDKPQTRRLMRTLQTRWMAMPRRQHARRERAQEVRVLFGFDRVWTLLEHRAPLPDLDSETTEWIIRNDSASGFALTLLGKQTDLVRPGAPMLVKVAGARNWMICVVRWARSSQDGEFELGVELLSHGAQAATVVFRNDAKSGQVPVAALRLPPLPGRRPHPCLMLKSGTATGRDMLIAHASGTRCRLGDARLSDLDLQTHAFELFELEELTAST